MALGGINRLSDQLRYALTACERDAVPLADELAFIDNYLALQRLRYGALVRAGRAPECQAAGYAPPAAAAARAASPPARAA